MYRNVVKLQYIVIRTDLNVLMSIFLIFEQSQATLTLTACSYKATKSICPFKAKEKKLDLFVFVLLQEWVFRPSAGFQGKSW